MYLLFCFFKQMSDYEMRISVLSSDVCSSDLTTLRSATEMVEPTTLRSSSVSAVRRETSSPLRLRSKNAWSSPTRCEYRRSQVGDHAFAQQRDEEEARGGRQRQRQRDREHQREGGVDVAATREAVVDHPSNHQ